MRVFVAIMGLLLLLSLGSQMVRHLFARTVAMRSSALDPFAKTTSKQIAESKSLDELVKLYAVAHEKVRVAKKTASPQESEYERRDREPYKSEEELAEAIRTWELHQYQILEVQFYWWAGAAAVGAGAVVIRNLNWWLGISLLLLGFMEMAYATCPAFSLGGSPDEFARLISYKAGYSIAAVVMLILAWAYVWRLLNARFPSQHTAL